MTRIRDRNNPALFVPALKRHDLFVGCSEEQLLEVAKLCRARKLDRKEVLFKSGQMSDGFYIVLSGMLRLFRQVGTNHQKTIRFIPAGDAFAEATIFENSTYPVSSAASIQSEVLWVPAEPIVKMLQQSWPMTANILKLFFIRFKAKVAKIGYLGFKEVKLRFAFFLLDQVEQQQDAKIQNPDSISLNMARKEIADHLATTPETVSRILKLLREGGILVPVGRHNFKINSDKLSKFIDAELDKQEDGPDESED